MTKEIVGYENLVGRVGLSKATITNLIKKGEFPKPTKRQDGRKKSNVWTEGEVCEWLSRKSAL